MDAASDIFVISDLHIGDGGPRDNFGHAESTRPEQLMAFLDYVEQENGELIIVGDLLEFWQSSLSKVIVHNLPLLDRFAELEATYVLGNHDADLLHFVGKSLLAHPLFASMTGPIERTIGGKRFKFMHGHEVDKANAGDTPGIGRVAAILAGIGEDLVGGPYLPNGKAVESYLMGIVGKAIGLWGWVVRWFKWKIAGGPPKVKGQLTPRQDPDRADEMLVLYDQNRQKEGYEVLIAGHTHQPGQMDGWYFNTGSWATTDNNFARIAPSGDVRLFDWIDGKPVANDNILSLPKTKDTKA
ncbi:MAG: UDP-2,3-diacylglucosamine diphosphatase [bacterium]